MILLSKIRVQSSLPCLPLRLALRYVSSGDHSTLFDEAKRFNSEINYSYVPSVLRQIESKWKTRIDNYWQASINHQNASDTNKAKYILSMFPYPSGQLHLGHIRIYTTSDVLFKTSVLCGQKSIHPMGFDSFGLPAENAAKLNNQNPFLWTDSNANQMKEQLRNMGYNFHWREKTSDPAFYRWTQWLFIQLYKAGLAYQGISQVNWDPVDCTVLADEQVDDQGRSWRSGAPVAKRFHKQWLVKTNAFAQELFAADDVLDTGHWSMILAIQRWWIKKPAGYLFYLRPNADQSHGSDLLQVFTKYPELFRSRKAFIGISKQHWLANGKEANTLAGRLDNPFIEGHQMDIRVVDDNIQTPASTHATVLVFREAFEDESIRREVVAESKSLGLGGYFTSDTYRDWLISRQRFWGTPIPIVHCPHCGTVPEREENLPVELPSIDYRNISDFKSQDIASPLKHFAPPEWLKTKCPSCGSDEAIRETDTCDTFFDSSWYFLRYFSPPEPDAPFDGPNLLPVYCYVGGKEHAALHLFYARFITHFLHSKGHISFREPFRTLLMQAIVKGRTYKLNGKYISAEEAANNPDVVVDFEKMSKSKGTGVNPDDLVALYSSDAVRWTLISVGNPPTERLWGDNEKEFGPTMVFFHRILLTIEEFIAAKKGITKLKVLDDATFESNLAKMTAAIDMQTFKILESISSSYKIQSATKAIHIVINALRTNMQNKIVLTAEFERGLASLLVMLSPMVPCFAAECWQAFAEFATEHKRLGEFGLDLSKPVYEQVWPKVINRDFKYQIKFTYRDENGREKHCAGIRVPLREIESWNESDIRQMLSLLDQQIEWIDIVKHCSVVVRVKNVQTTRQILQQSSFELVQLKEKTDDLLDTKSS